MVWIKLTEKGKYLFICATIQDQIYSKRYFEGEMEGMGSRGGDGKRGEKIGREDGGDG